MLAKIWNFNGWITETDPEALSMVFGTILRKAGFTILGELTHLFQPQGYTNLYLLCESHFAVHTFPEEGKTYIELSSCNATMYNKAVEYIKEAYDISKT